MPSSKTLSGYDRQEHDWNVEPEAATMALLAAESFRGNIYDPACGGGNVVQACQTMGYRAVGSDLIRRVPEGTPWFVGVRDFVAERRFMGSSVQPDNIISNPPFKHWVEFAEAALEEARWKVALFAGIGILTGNGLKGKPWEGRRLRVWHRLPVCRVYFFSDRVNCPPGDRPDKGKRTTKDHVWVIFDRDHKGPWTGHHLVAGDFPDHLKPRRAP